jgi:hypothetical protein
LAPGATVAKPAVDAPLTAARTQPRDQLQEKTHVKNAGEKNVLSSKDLAIGTVIALVMTTIFVTLSSGRSLLVTFIPGLLVAWLIYAWMFLKQIELPRAEAFVPLFFAGLAIQFLHFSEEFITDFKTFFPAHYGGAPYSDNLFVVFNLLSYALFTTACVLVFFRNVRFLLMPVLFFVVYGALGNAISHTSWVLDAGAYRPGFVTALAYWIVGPWLLYKLLGRRSSVVVAVVGFAAVLVPAVTIFAVR